MWQNLFDYLINVKKKSYSIVLNVILYVEFGENNNPDKV